MSRILFAMGRDGILPRQFAYLHKTRRTPWVAIILVGALSLLLSLTLTQDTVSNLVSFGALFGFLLNLSVIYRFYLCGEKNLLTTLKYLLSPLIGFAVSLWIFLSLATSAKIVGGLWLLVGFLILLVKTRGFRQPTPRLEL